MVALQRMLSFLLTALACHCCFNVLFYTAVPTLGYHTSMAIFYSSLDLHKLNSTYRLPVDIYNYCAHLQIVRRPRYVHRGSRRSFYKDAQFTSLANDVIPVISSCRPSSKPVAKLRSVNLLNLCSIKISSPNHEIAESQALRMALINARSLSNKSFILNDFFTTNSLDFLFVTETWLKPDEFSSLGELSPRIVPFLPPQDFLVKVGVLLLFLKIVLKTINCKRMCTQALKYS